MAWEPDSSGRAVGMAVLASPEGTRLVVAGERDERTFPIGRAGKKAALRFAVGEPGLRATVWRLWANSGFDDVYLASRQTAHEMKISLHQSGDWRMQVVEPARPKTVHFSSRQDDAGRILMRWERPEPNSVGWTHALTIVLPGGHLNVIPADSVRWDDVRWLPAPAEDEQVELDVHIVRPDGGMLGFRDMLADGVRISVMDALQLASGDVVVVTAFTGPVRRDELAWIKATDGDPRLNDLPPEWDRSAQLSPRRLLYSLVEGTPRLYDLAMRKQ